MPIAVSAHEKIRPLRALELYVYEKLKLGDHFVDLQRLKPLPALKKLAKFELKSKQRSSNLWL